MWQKGVEFGKQLLSITQRLQKHEEDVKELRQEIREIRQDINRLRQEMGEVTRIVERLALEWQREHETAARDREILQLRLENTLLRFERGLPPGGHPDEPQTS